MTDLPPLQPNGNEFAETVPGPIWKCPPVDDEERRQRRRAELWIILVLKPQMFDLFESLDAELPLFGSQLFEPAGPSKVKEMLARIIEANDLAPLPGIGAQQVRDIPRGAEALTPSTVWLALKPSGWATSGPLRLGSFAWEMPAGAVDPGEWIRDVTAGTMQMLRKEPDRYSVYKPRALGPTVGILEMLAAEGVEMAEPPTRTFYGSVSRCSETGAVTYRVGERNLSPQTFAMVFGWRFVDGGEPPDGQVFEVGKFVDSLGDVFGDFAREIAVGCQVPLEMLMPPTVVSDQAAADIAELATLIRRNGRNRPEHVFAAGVHYTKDGAHEMGHPDCAVCQSYERSKESGR